MSTAKQLSRRAALGLIAVWPLVSEAAGPTDVSLNFGELERVTIITKWGRATLNVKYLYDAVRSVDAE